MSELEQLKKENEELKAKLAKPKKEGHEDKADIDPEIEKLLVDKYATLI